MSCLAIRDSQNCFRPMQSALGVLIANTPQFKSRTPQIPKNLDFAPRVGIAFQVDKDTVIRADRAVSDAVFERRSCGNGTKGPRYSDWALIATADPREFLLIRRLDREKNQYTFYLCWAPEGRPATMTYFIVIAGRRWPVEETFKTGNACALHCGSVPSGFLE